MNNLTMIQIWNHLKKIKNWKILQRKKNNSNLKNYTPDDKKVIFHYANSNKVTYITKTPSPCFKKADKIVQIRYTQFCVDASTREIYWLSRCQTEHNKRTSVQ